MNPVEHTGEEKRITFQLYNYWFGLANDLGIPPLTALQPNDIAPYKNNMVLIDLRDRDNEPTLQVIGQLLLEDLDQDLTFKGVSEIPRRTLLSRITDHYMEVLANRTPISFDAEFKNKTRDKILYRGILLPFSDDGKDINFILGAIRWIREDEIDLTRLQNQPEENAPSDLPPEKEESEASAPDFPSPDFTPKEKEGLSLPAQLENCRNAIQGKSPADLRSRQSLYLALGTILDFHETCMANPQQYGELLSAEGLKAQDRAPFTPTLKLCFGRDYDKTRLTEYAAALSHARKNNQTGKSLPQFLDSFPGGIKGCVKAEREERHKTTDKPNNNPEEKARQIIDQLSPIARFDVIDNPPRDNNLYILLARGDGPHLEVIKILKEEEKIMDKILKHIAKDP